MVLRCVVSWKVGMGNASPPTYACSSYQSTTSCFHTSQHVFKICFPGHENPAAFDDSLALSHLGDACIQSDLMNSDEGAGRDQSLLLSDAWRWASTSGFESRTSGLGVKHTRLDHPPLLLFIV